MCVPLIWCIALLGRRWGVVRFINNGCQLGELTAPLEA
jgi:hypothetical protein